MNACSWKDTTLLSLDGAPEYRYFHATFSFHSPIFSFVKTNDCVGEDATHTYYGRGRRRDLFFTCLLTPVSPVPQTPLEYAKRKQRVDKKQTNLHTRHIMEST